LNREFGFTFPDLKQGGFSFKLTAIVFSLDRIGGHNFVAFRNFTEGVFGRRLVIVLRMVEQSASSCLLFLDAMVGLNTIKETSKITDELHIVLEDSLRVHPRQVDLVSVE
jgi:hypothetical protein